MEPGQRHRPNHGTTDPLAAALLQTPYYYDYNNYNNANSNNNSNSNNNDYTNNNHTHDDYRAATATMPTGKSRPLLPLTADLLPVSAPASGSATSSTAGATTTATATTTGRQEQDYSSTGRRMTAAVAAVAASLPNANSSRSPPVSSSHGDNSTPRSVASSTHEPGERRRPPPHQQSSRSQQQQDKGQQVPQQQQQGQAGSHSSYCFSHQCAKILPTPVLYALRAELPPVTEGSGTAAAGSGGGSNSSPSRVAIAAPKPLGQEAVKAPVFPYAGITLYSRFEPYSIRAMDSVAVLGYHHNKLRLRNTSAVAASGDSTTTTTTTTTTSTNGTEKSSTDDDTTDSRASATSNNNDNDNGNSNLARRVTPPAPLTASSPSTPRFATAAVAKPTHKELLAAAPQNMIVPFLSYKPRILTSRMNPTMTSAEINVAMCTPDHCLRVGGVMEHVEPIVLQNIIFEITGVIVEECVPKGGGLFCVVLRHFETEAAVIRSLHEHVWFGPFGVLHLTTTASVSWVKTQLSKMRSRRSRAATDASYSFPKHLMTVTPWAPYNMSCY